ncbi:hypothetical protein HPB47_027819 [Ixodes persulcatus]|uniref:Uncharacterized protein n=1 Tax=Ixodes persulcatus TaxID=34615 RepID=A0AC60PUW6_IXOPE|nr:hypothetical protein HPB47_027819 [Ixodes persulcatus]
MAAAAIPAARTVLSAPIPEGKQIVVEVVHLIADATGISVSSVYEIKRGFKRANGAVKTFSKKRPNSADKKMKISSHDAYTLTAPNSVIVIENAPYHSRKAVAIPRMTTKNGEIQQWLCSKSLNWTATMKKKDLSLVATVKDHYKNYKVDVIATDAGHTVLRLPLYHFDLNPMELVWARLKLEVASQNASFKPNDAERLLRAAVDNVTTVHWHDWVEHVKIMEAKFRKCDVPESNLEPVISPLDASDTEKESGDDDEAGDEDEGEEIFDVHPLEWN